MKNRFVVYGVLIVVAVGVALFTLSKDTPPGRNPFALFGGPTTPATPWKPSAKLDAEANAEFKIETDRTDNVPLAGKPLQADWPQFNGAKRDNKSSETGLLEKWPEGGPPLAWVSHGVGSGYSTVSVVDGVLYTMGNKGSTEAIIALDAGTGEKIWSTPFAWASRLSNGDGPRSTPTVSGGAVYGLGGKGDVVCLDAKSGDIRWQTNILSEFGGSTPGWGTSESVLVDGNRVICTPGGDKATIVALAAESGEVIWKFASPDADDAAYASAIVIETDGLKQYVQLLEKGLVGLDAKTGAQLWRYTGIIKEYPNIPTPVSRKDVVYGATAKGLGGSVRLKRSGRGIEAAEIYADAKLPRAIGGSVEVNGYLYGTGSEALMCVDFNTGELKWQARGVGTGSVCYADGRLYVHAEKPPGEMALVEATPEEYREHGRFTPTDGPENRIADVGGQAEEGGKAKKVGDGKTWAYPTIANGRLYIRDWICLWCYDIKAK